MKETMEIPLSRQCYEMIEALSDRLQQKNYAVIESQDVVFAALDTADTGLSYLLGNYGILRREFLEEEECAKRVECRAISTADAPLSFEERRARVKQILADPVELVKEPVSSSVVEAFSSLPLSRQVADAYERAQEQAMQTRDCQALDTSFFLSAFLNDPTSNAYHLLRKLFYQKGVIKDDEALNGFDFFTNRYFRFRDGVREEEKRNEEKFASLTRVKYRNPDYSILQEISTDLTEKAEKGLLSPLIGREKEMEQMAICLCRRDKNNFVLLGSAGVGKSALIEGLAQRIVKGDYPALAKKRIRQFHLSRFWNSSPFADSLAMEKLMAEMRQEKNVVLFLDEIHLLSRMRWFTDILKPLLARSDFRLIGATTAGEWNAYLSHDQALARRFERIIVNEPSQEEAIAIVRNASIAYENYHHLNYNEDAIFASVVLAKRYLPKEMLPDVALTLLDNAGSRFALKHNMEQPLQKAYEKQLTALKKQLEKAKSQLYNEDAVETIRRKIDALQEKSSKIRSNAKRKTYAFSLGAEEIRLEIEQRIGRTLDPEHLQKTLLSSHGLNHLRERIKARIIGQDQAVDSLVDAIIRSEKGLRYPHQPMASFLFVGPTGVGKTELTKVVAEEYLGDPTALVRFDMSEYQQPHEVSKLIGAPPGYAGYGHGGQLTNAIRNNPRCVLLFDEIEKAHPKIYDLFLQLLDEGRLTDGSGIVVDFSQSLIVMTSNLGTAQMVHSKTIGFADTTSPLNEEDVRAITFSAIEQFFRPEFINRLDEIITFKPFGSAEVEAITRLLLKEEQQMMEKNGYSLHVTEGAIHLLAQKGLQPESGARAIKRAIKKWIRTPIANRLITWKEEKADIYVKVHAGTLQVNVGGEK
ncbi:AAA family ATPase [uncultured Levyella sp.]|uniref:AAA family ATPase n=1 Tax=uncultured Levyella sp. TaxID=1715800 RepID=UPI0025847B12|nr:ATP-dependent Clp protease ATP-binding subunit [uncultured Levyella sp.]